MRRGFTLIELLVVISIIGLLSSIVLTTLNFARAKARDARRLQDMHQIQMALEVYRSSNGTWPAAVGYNVSGSPCQGFDFGNQDRPLLAGVMGETMPVDPSAKGACSGYYYYRYPAGYYGPADRGMYYILGVKDMETSNGRHPASPGFSRPGDPATGQSPRNWQSEFEWVTGKYETE